MNVRTELERFAFLIGRFRCEARVKLPGGEWKTFGATWEGRWILNGHAIADEYLMFGTGGDLVVLGLNLRAYDSANQRWNLKWLDALTGRWTDLGPEELGGVRIDGDSVSYQFREPMAGQAFTRATYENITANHFTWKGEASDDGEHWTEFMVVECERDRQGLR